MDAAHLHLMLNHFPIAGLLFFLPILILAWLRKDETLSRVGLVATVVTGLLSLATFFTGEPAEEIIEHLPGISENVIKVHQEAGELAIWFVVATAVLALITLFLKRNQLVSRFGLPAVVILAFVSAGFLARANNLGGQISHPEIRSKSAAGISAPSGEEHEKGDDD